MLFAPFLMIYSLLFLGLLLILLIWFQVSLVRVFVILGLRPSVAILVLFASLIGSYVNIPLYTVESGPRPVEATADNFGVIYEIPFEYGIPRTTIAINVGGAIIPLLISAYVLLKTPAGVLPSMVGTAIVALVAHQFAYPLRGLGIAIPIFVGPLTAALVALLLGRLMRVPRTTHVIAYVSGVLGTLIGADLMNLDKIANLGAPVASIGGAGTFDSVFLTGVIAVLLARF
jgi:uncharacterized membrane protein